MVIGFDLDMTLIDSRPGIKAVYDVIADETGTDIDSDLVVSRLGPPVEHELAHWFPADRVPAMAELFRERYSSYAVAPTHALPGAAAALAAVGERGGRVCVITGKTARHARQHLEHLALPVDDITGRAWREGKSRALQDSDAVAYVGDHVEDVAAARTAGVIAVAVTTGSSSGMELQAAGADVVLHSLLDFPDWLADIAARPVV